MKNMKKVFLLSPLALENGRGGEISSMELATGLNKLYNVTFMDTNILIGKKSLSNNAIRKKLINLKKKGRMIFATFSFHGKTFTFPYPSELLRLYREIKQNDIIYSSYLDVKLSLLIIFFSVIHRKGKFIIGYRKPPYSEKVLSLYNLKYRLSILLFSMFKKNIVHHALSSYAKSFLDNFYDPNSVIHITHGIDLDKYKGNELTHKKHEVLNFVFIGYLDSIDKGVDVLLEAINELIEENKNLKIFFEFCGMGPLVKEVEELANKYPDYVRFNGYISNEEVDKHYKKNDVFLFTSRRETLPRTIMEALAGGLVILSSKTIGSIELLKGQKFAYFLKELTPLTIKETIIKIYNLWDTNFERFNQLQIKAKEFVFKNYSFEKELNEFKLVIDRGTFKK
ncbi:MAG: glycosyltransferase family 4 protein [Promethearchaeota archaeon]